MLFLVFTHVAHLFSNYFKPSKKFNKKSNSLLGLAENVSALPYTHKQWYIQNTQPMMNNKKPLFLHKAIFKPTHFSLLKHFIQWLGISIIQNEH